MGGFAWVTLATNDSYSLGALVLAHSLRRAGTKHDLAVLITPGVTQVMRDKLATVFTLVQEVNVLDSKEEANLALLARPELGITFTKLHCWRLTQYEKCVFVDADALVIRNCDELFEREELSAAPDVGWPDCFNSGVFVFQPSQQTFASITAFAAEKGSFDGGDQGLLNSYFSDWAHKDIAKHLPFIYNMCSTATYSYLPAYKQYGENARIIHFIGATKPWLQYFDTETGVVHPPSGCHHLQPLLQLWWNIFCENVHSQLSPVMARSTLAPIWHRFTPSLPGTSAPSYPIYDDSSHSRTHRSEQLQNHDANDDNNDYDYDYDKKPADFSEFNDPWEEYIPKSTPMNNVVFFHREYIGEQYYDNIKAEQQQNHENSDKNHSHVRSEDFHNDFKQPSGDGVTHEHYVIATEFTGSKNSEYRKNEENSNLQGGFEAGGNEARDNEFRGNETDYFENRNVENEVRDNEFKGNETDYFENRNVEEINARLHGESISRDQSDNVDSLPSRDHGQTDPAIHSFYQPLSREPCTDPLHNVAQHNDQSVDSQGHLATEDAGIAGALAKMTLGEPRSSEQSALEEHMRRQGWEQGQIDYMGRDSFDNIWKKICSTLDEAPPIEPTPVKEEETLETESSLVPDATPVAEPSPTTATETETEVESDSLRLSEDPAGTILDQKIPPATTETIDPPTVQDQPEIQAELKLEPAEPQDQPDAKSVVSETIAPETDATPKETPAEIQTVESVASAAPITPLAAPAVDAPDVESPVEPEEEISTPEVDSIGETKAEQFISTYPPTPDIIPAPVDESTQSVSELSEFILDSSSVPIQVAESVLQSEPKESVSQDPRPVSEEAISSVVAPVLESVTAVSETVAEPKEEEKPERIDNGVDVAPEAASKSEESEPEPEAKESAVPVPAEQPKAAEVPVKEAEPEPEVEVEPEVEAEPELEPELEAEPEEEPLSAVSDSSKSTSLTPPDSPSTQCPVRPARTKDPRVPTTPTVTEATPPNSPPIGPGQNLEDQPKTVKKVVKKVVKKIPVESESGDVVEGETSGKKVVKKVIKKVVKKPKEPADNGAEVSGAGAAVDKPKKVVKIVKKVVKPSESLEVDPSIPETPPAGVPVPPKRKTKTTTTTTTTKVTTTTKNVPAESKPSESEP